MRIARGLRDAIAQIVFGVTPDRDATEAFLADVKQATRADLARRLNLDDVDLDILRLVARGASNREIGPEVHLSGGRRQGPDPPSHDAARRRGGAPSWRRRRCVSGWREKALAVSPRMRSGFVHHVDVTVADHQQVVVRRARRPASRITDAHRAWRDGVSAKPSPPAPPQRPRPHASSASLWRAHRVTQTCPILVGWGSFVPAMIEHLSWEERVHE